MRALLICAALALATPALAAEALKPVPLPAGPMLAVIGDSEGFFFAAEATVRRDGDILRLTVLYAPATDADMGGMAVAAVAMTLDCAKNYDHGGVTSTYDTNGALLENFTRDPAPINATSANEQLVQLYCKGAVEAGWPRQDGWRGAAAAAPQMAKASGGKAMARLPGKE